MNNRVIVLNKKNINKVLEDFCFFSDPDDVQYVSGMIGMLECLGLRVYRMGEEWIMEDKDGNELGRKTIQIEENI